MIPSRARGRDRAVGSGGLPAAAGRVMVMSESNLDPAELAENVDSLLTANLKSFKPIPCNGAQRSAEILAAHLH